MQRPWAEDEDSTWLLGTQIKHGEGLIVRVRTDTSSKALRSTYSFALALLWRFHCPRCFGMPTKRLQAKIERCQDGIEAVLESSFEGVSVAVHTGWGEVWSLWYVKDPRLAREIVMLEADRIPELPYEILLERDANWSKHKASIRASQCG